MLSLKGRDNIDVVFSIEPGRILAAGGTIPPMGTKMNLEGDATFKVFDNHQKLYSLTISKIKDVFVMPRSPLIHH